LRRNVKIDEIIKGILAQGVEEEAVPLAVLRQVAIEDDGHQSAEVLDHDGLSVERSDEGLCDGDDERALGLGCTFSLCVSRYLLSSLPDDAFSIGLSHDEQVVAVVARDYSGSKKVAGATDQIP
jgi:hypothetical protein